VMVSPRERMVMPGCLSQTRAVVVHAFTVRSFGPISYLFLRDRRREVE